MPTLSVTLFGVPRIERDGVAVTVKRRKSLALLAYLAVTRQPHGRDALATLLWPDAAGERARAGLRRSLVDLNTALGKGCLDAEGDQVALRADVAMQADVERFHAGLARSPATAIHLIICAMPVSPTWPRRSTSIPPTSWPASRWRTRPGSTTGRPFRPRACGWSWRVCWRNWRRGWRAASNGRRPSPTPGAGWRSTPSTSRLTVC